MNLHSPVADLHLSAESLEHNELLSLTQCPFTLPAEEELAFLRQQEPRSRGNKDLSFDPNNRRLSGAGIQAPSQHRRLAEILVQFSQEVSAWLLANFPEYSGGLARDRVTVRTREEATRTTRLTARNDLLHIDHFPTRPSFGRRILRVFVNIDAEDSHVWAVSEHFPELLARFAASNRIPAWSLKQWTSPTNSMVRLFQGKKPNRSGFDAWMLKLHHFLKENHGFQTKAARRVHTFQPGTAWMLFADGLAHAQLRGRFALEHSFFVEPDCLVAPSEWPAAILERAGRNRHHGRAA